MLPFLSLFFAIFILPPFFVFWHHLSPYHLLSCVSRHLLPQQKGASNASFKRYVIYWALQNTRYARCKKKIQLWKFQSQVCTKPLLKCQNQCVSCIRNLMEGAGDFKPTFPPVVVTFIARPLAPVSPSPCRGVCFAPPGLTPWKSKLANRNCNRMQIPLPYKNVSTFAHTQLQSQIWHLTRLTRCPQTHERSRETASLLS